MDDDDDDDDDEVLTRAYFIALKCIPSGSAASVAQAVLTNGEGSESVCACCKVTVPLKKFRLWTDGVQENQMNCDILCTLEVPNLDFQPIPPISKF